MKKTPPTKIGVNEALRKAGFVAIPRWWVTPDELEVIHRMAHNHEQEVTRIRRRVNALNGYPERDDQ